MYRWLPGENPEPGGLREPALLAEGMAGFVAAMRAVTLPGAPQAHRGGDPACDLFPAWNLLPAGAREIFRAALGVDDATWNRGRGRTLSQALIASPYYRRTSPAMARNARHVIQAALGEGQLRRP